MFFLRLFLNFDDISRLCSKLKSRLFLVRSAPKNQSKFQNFAFLLFDIQIWIAFYKLTWEEKVTFKNGPSLMEIGS